MLDRFLLFTDTPAFKCIFLCIIFIMLNILRIEFKRQDRIGIYYATGILSLIAFMGSIMWGFLWLN